MVDHQEESLTQDSHHHDVLIKHLNKVVVFCVKCLAVLMVVVVVWGVVDVIAHLYFQIRERLESIYEMDNFFSILGTFLAVLIAIEIFKNIVFYLRKDAIHVPLVLATALTAVARKVIIIDYSAIDSMQMLATAAIILAVGITYWLIIKQGYGPNENNR